jgi:hypothetical protein
MTSGITTLSIMDLVVVLRMNNTHLNVYQILTVLLNVVMRSVVMLSVAMLNVFMLIVIMQNSG